MYLISSVYIFMFSEPSQYYIIQRYKSDGQDTVVLAGAEYGSGSSRDWAAKGPMLLVGISFMSPFGMFSPFFLFCFFPMNIKLTC